MSSTAPVDARVSTLQSKVIPRLEWSFGAILVAFYIAVFNQFESLPYQDAPNHLARAVVMADLIFHHGAQFGSVFQFHFEAIPYILGDMVLTIAVELFGPSGGNAVWTGIVLASLPLSLLFFMRAHRIGANGQIVALLLATYLSTDWFFLMGFFAFRLAVAMTLVALGLVQLIRTRWSGSLYVVYCLILILSYLIHLSALVFVCAAVGTSAALRLWWRSTSIRTESCLLAPILILFAWHFGVGAGYALDTDRELGSYKWSSLSRKIARLPWPFLRFNVRIDLLMLAMFAVCIVWPLRRWLRGTRHVPRQALEMIALAAAFFGMYMVLPMSGPDAGFLDVRPLALVPIFGMMACLYCWDESAISSDSVRRFVVPLATVLALGNLVYLADRLSGFDRWMQGYRDVISAVPRGARVMLVYTHPAGRRGIAPELHSGEFVVTDRGGITPDIFSGNAGNPMKYFRYVDRPYAPAWMEWWYDQWFRKTMDWNSVACDHDYLLVMKPFDPIRIRLPTTTLSENASGALLSIPRTSCVGRPPDASRSWQIRPTHRDQG